MLMIVIGADPHKAEHTLVAVDAGSGQLLGELSVNTKPDGMRRLRDWARALGAERVFAIEDCRQVSGSLERFLVARGERVVRVAPKLMAGARRAVRERGNSDPIDALAIARACLREGPERLPVAFLDREAREIKLLLDHREDFEQEQTRITNRLRWHLHDLWPELEIPRGALSSFAGLDRIARRLARAEQSARVRVARDQVAQIRRLERRSRELERELTALVKAKNPALLELPGCGALTAAKLLAETAGAERFSSEAELARMAGVAPIPVSSGRSDRHRLDRGGNRQLNRAFHRIAFTQRRMRHEPGCRYLERKECEGKTPKEALRCLKRQLVRTVLGLLRPPTSDQSDSLAIRKRSRTPNSAAALT